MEAQGCKMKVTKWTHRELYGVSGAYFANMIPMLEERKRLACEHLQKLVHDTEPEDYSKHQRQIFAVNKAIEFNQELIDDILKDMK